MEIQTKSLILQKQSIIMPSIQIKSAIQEDRIIINNQAILNNVTGKIEKHEVLVRALDRDQSLLYPDQFLDVAKTSKQYLNITKAVIEKSFKQFKNLPYSFSINITVEDILSEELQEFLFEKMNAYGIGERLIVEIVESEQIKEYEPIMKFVKKLKQYGAKLAIDDFGSGYSNFNHVLELDADFVKIDGTIVSKVCENKHSAEIIKSIVSFCHNMGILTVAEFVSSKEILNKVQELGVDYSQGFYISKPQDRVQESFFEH